MFRYVRPVTEGILLGPMLALHLLVLVAGFILSMVLIFGYGGAMTINGLLLLLFTFLATFRANLITVSGMYLILTANIIGLFS